MDKDFEILKETILYIFKKRKTAFLMTGSILKEVRFQKEIYPKEDQERLDALLETMRGQDLITLNQPKFAALTDAGKRAVESLTEARVLEIENDMKARLA